MYHSIQLTKTTSSRATSQVTRPNDNKAIGGTRFHALIAGLRPASLILARRIAFPLLFLAAGLVLIQPCAGQSGTWTATGSLITARELHTATLLPDGKVLVAGGFNPPGNSSASAELYDPASGTWTATGSLATAREVITRRRCCPTARCSSQAGSTARAALRRARNSTIRRAGPGRRPAASPPHALITRRRCCPTARCSSQAAGTAATSQLASAELYDPASGTWTATGSLATARTNHTATLLPNGKVLVAGGYNGTSAFRRARNSTIRRAAPGRRPAASPPDALFTRRRCCPTARCSSQEDWTTTALRERGTLRSGERDLDGHRQPRHRTLSSHGDVAA